VAKYTAHTQYKNRNGITVPGVTTVIGQLNKPQLVAWANRLGLQGINSNKYRDEMAEIGTLAHSMILAQLGGDAVDFNDFTPEQMSKARNCMRSYDAWDEGKLVMPIVVEKPMVSEHFQYGGTPDFYGWIDGKITLADYKTGSIYKEAYIQACAYYYLLVENGYAPAEQILILGIPRTNDENFKEVRFTDPAIGWELFKHLRTVYELMKAVPNV
jgi:hypothetical protein